MKRSKEIIPIQYLYFIGICIIVLGISVNYVVSMRIENLLIDVGNRNAISVAENLGNQILNEFNELFANDNIDSMNIGRYISLGRRIRNAVNALDIKELYLYNKDGWIIYSTSDSKIGMDASFNEGFIDAKNGIITADIDKSTRLLETYLPLDIISSMPIDKSSASVIEIYQEADNLIVKIDEAKSFILFVTLISMGIIMCLLGLIYNVGNRSKRDSLMLKEKEIKVLNNELKEKGKKIDDLNKALNLNYANFEKGIMENILNNMNAGLIVLDMNERIFWVNREAGDIFNKENRDMVGKYMYEVVWLKELNQSVSEVLRTGREIKQSEVLLSVENRGVILIALSVAKMMESGITLGVIVLFSELYHDKGGKGAVVRVRGAG
ncbi:MAG: PAS domain-containing protein [Nitrospirota bacterium]